MISGIGQGSQKVTSKEDTMANTKQDKQQIKDEKIGSIVYETHVYQSPLGPGSIQYEYRKSGQDMERKKTHVGPEAIADEDWTVVPDVTVDEQQQTGTTTENLDVWRQVENPPGSGTFERVLTQETHQVPVYSTVQVTYKHPYKAKHFGL